MQIIIDGKKFESGKINRPKYSIYLKAKEKLTEKEEKGLSFNDDDLDLMVSTLVKLYDNQFTEDDINNNFEISDILFEFMHCDVDTYGSFGKKVSDVQKKFLK